MRFFCIFSSIAVVVLLASLSLEAQNKTTSMFNVDSKDKPPAAPTPTVITSDSMTVDMGRNMAVFSGNVLVNSEQMTINCNKMIIYIEDKEPEKEPETPASAPKTDEAKKTDDTKKTDEAKKTDTGNAIMGSMGMNSENSKKELSRIICSGNVVITRKIIDPAEAEKGDQKAISGRADYDFKSGKIVLSEDNPVVFRGYDELRAKKITLWRDSERIEAEGNIKITATPPADMKNMMSGNTPAEKDQNKKTDGKGKSESDNKGNTESEKSAANEK